MPDIKRIAWELQDFTGKRVWGGEDLPSAHRISMTVSNGGRVSIELWEREPGVIEVRVHDGAMEVLPVAANTIQVRNRTYFEKEEAQQQKEKKRGNRKQTPSR